MTLRSQHLLRALGSLATFASVAVSVGCSSSEPNTRARTEALEHWLASLPVAPRQSPRDPALAAEGEALFAREGCADCHSGELGSDRRLHQVLETPAITAPLAGVAARAPYLRDGRATDLEEALVAHDLGVSDEERAALQAYLESR